MLLNELQIASTEDSSNEIVREIIYRMRKKLIFTKFVLFYDEMFVNLFFFSLRLVAKNFGHNFSILWKFLGAILFVISKLLSTLLKDWSYNFCILSS